MRTRASEPRASAKAEPATKQTGRDQGQKQIERDRTESEPERTVRSDEWDNGVPQADGRIPVENRRHNMHNDER